MTHLPPGAEQAPPVCHRHPDRVAYVRCQRCGRPTCPECQRPAAVGIQCVDCVAAAARSTPAGRTVLGGKVRGGRPVVTLTIIGLCLVSYGLQWAIPTWTARWAFMPLLGASEPWTFLTSAFLHSRSSLLHLVFNMIALWMVGPFLETALGRARYVALYLVSALGASVGVLLAVWLTGDWGMSTVGASGAVFGLFGAVLVVLRRLGRSAGGFLGIVAVNLVLGFVVQGIAWQAHVGGLVVGALLGAAFAYAPRSRQRLFGVAAPVVVAAGLVTTATLVYAAVGLL